MSTLLTTRLRQPSLTRWENLAGNFQANGNKKAKQSTRARRMVRIAKKSTGGHLEITVEPWSINGLLKSLALTPPFSTNSHRQDVSQHNAQHLNMLPRCAKFPPFNTTYSIDPEEHSFRSCSYKNDHMPELLTSPLLSLSLSYSVALKAKMPPGKKHGHSQLKKGRYLVGFSNYLQSIQPLCWNIASNLRWINLTRYAESEITLPHYYWNDQNIVFGGVVEKPTSKTMSKRLQKATSPSLPRQDSFLIHQQD